MTPTLGRPDDVEALLLSLSRQKLLPQEVILVDGADVSDTRTESVAAEAAAALPFRLVYDRCAPGTAKQRNSGIEQTKGDLIAFFDDDVRPEEDFLQRIVEVFDTDAQRRIGGVVGYRSNLHFSLESRARWRWYRRLRLLSTFVPGAYDRKVGYPINANLQPPFSGTRSVDFMTTACATWRRQVFSSALRFDEFFSDYGVLEDAHLSLRAAESWLLLQCGDARCVELHSAPSRVSRRAVGFKSVVNYYYVFQDVCGPLSWRQELRFWLFQAFEMMRLTAIGVSRLRADCLSEVVGKLKGTMAVAGGTLRRSLESRQPQARE